MNLYIFENAEKVSDHYHSGGGLVVIAKDIKRVKELVLQTNGEAVLSDEDIANANMYELKNDNENETIYFFPDAGCC